MRVIFAKMRKEDHKRGGGRWQEEVGRLETSLFVASWLDSMLRNRGLLEVGVFSMSFARWSSR